MTATTKTIQIDNRTYDVVTDESKRHDMMTVYCQIYRLQKNGRRVQIVSLPLIFQILKLSRAV